MSNLNLAAAGEFADDPRPRCPCANAAHTAGSVQGEKINASAPARSAELMARTDRDHAKVVEYYRPWSFLIAWILFASIGRSQGDPPKPPAPSATESAVAKIEFSDSPEAGKSFHGPDGMNMIWISPGTFQMGDATGSGGSDEKPVHEVRLTKGYWLSETVVTQIQWVPLMEKDESQFIGDNVPVDNVNKGDAMDFCKKLTERERARGHLAAGMEYRLPTEAQWEYACRAGTKGDFAGDLDAMAWYAANSGGTTHEVKTKRPNAWGLYDMHGNVWQWCSDWHGDYTPGLQVDPTGPAKADTTGKTYSSITRGGSWADEAMNCRSATRIFPSRIGEYLSLGVRVAAVLTEVAAAPPAKDNPRGAP